MSPHGTRARYTTGCRCDDCRRANAAYQQQLSIKQAAERRGEIPPRFVPAAVVADHLEMLSRHQIGRHRVTALTGVSDSQLRKIRAGITKRVRAETAEKILAVTTEDKALHATTDSARARHYLEALLAAGLTRYRIAHALGAKMPALQRLKGDRCLVKTERQLEVLVRLYAPEALDWRPPAKTKVYELEDLPEPAEADFLIFGSKACTLCGKELPASAEFFHTDTTRPDGLTSRCRVCRNAAGRRDHHRSKKATA